MAKVRTRMQKARILNTQAAAGAGTTNITSNQLEGGDEECQIKRLCISAASEHIIFVTVALADEAFTGAADFTDNRILYTFVSTGPMVINETTTIRVPRGHHLGINVSTASGNPGATQADVVCQVNYLVLS